nr:unnamed protein product [Callosobruchus chinensis]
MSGRPLTDEELEELANQISSDSEADDEIEVENFWDSDDSIADPDFIPDDNDVEEAFENELMNVWMRQMLLNPQGMKLYLLNLVKRD